MTISDKSIKDFLERYYLKCDPTLNVETFGRYRREARKRFPDWLSAMELKHQMEELYTPAEIKAISTSKRIPPKEEHLIPFDGDKFKFAFITDTHFGAKCFNEDVWNSIVDEINKSDVDMVIHTGDITNGCDKRKEDMVFSLTHIGYAEQKAYAIDLLSKINKPIYAVSGNHDRFFFKSCGALIVEDIAHELDNFHYLGEDTADLIINNELLGRGENPRGIRIRLWHGEDASGSATSSRLQSLVGSFSRNDYPDILLCGHTHKQCYLFERDVHVLSGGAVCGQSSWMKSKKLVNHQGFHMVEVEYNERGVTKFSPTWYPFYS